MTIVCSLAIRLTWLAWRNVEHVAQLGLVQVDAFDVVVVDMLKEAMLVLPDL